MTCPDCANAALEYRVGPMCAYHALITAGDADPRLQALAVAIAPVSFEKVAESQRYFALCKPDRGRKFGPYEEREIWAAYDAARRVALLVGWS